MRKVYYKDGVEVKKPDVVIINGLNCYSPSDNQIEQAGYEIREIIDPIPEPYVPTYEERVVTLIRERYDLDDELAIQRQRDTKPEEFQEYFNYCEECKRRAKEDE